MRHLIISIFLFSLAVLFISYRFWGYPNSIIKIEGKLESYSFSAAPDGKGGTNDNYFLSLIGDSKNYKIPAKFLDYLNKTEFESDFQKGKKVELLISDNKNKIGNHFDIYSISTNGKNYLPTEKTIKIDALEKNVAIPIFVLLFAFVGWLNFRKYKR